MNEFDEEGHRNRTSNKYVGGDYLSQLCSSMKSAWNSVILGPSRDETQEQQIKTFGKVQSLVGLMS